MSSERWFVQYEVLGNGLLGEIADRVGVAIGVAMRYDEDHPYDECPSYSGCPSDVQVTLLGEPVASDVIHTSALSRTLRAVQIMAWGTREFEGLGDLADLASAWLEARLGAAGVRVRRTL